MEPNVKPDGQNLFDWIVDKIVARSALSKDMDEIKAEDIDEEYIKNLLKKEIPDVFDSRRFTGWGVGDAESLAF